MDFPTVTALLAEWEGRPVSVAVDRERLRTGFKPMAVFQGELGGMAIREEVGQGPGIQNVPYEDLPPERRMHALFYPIGFGQEDPLKVHGPPGFYISRAEFTHAGRMVRGLLIVSGRDLEIQVQLLDEESES